MTKNSHHHKLVEPVTLVFAFTVKKGKEKEFEDWAHEITDAVTHFEGHLGSNWIRTSSTGRDYTVIVKFLDVEDSNKWLKSTIRKSFLKKVDPLVKQSMPNRLQKVTGLKRGLPYREV